MVLFLFFLILVSNFAGNVENMEWQNGLFHYFFFSSG